MEKGCEKKLAELHLVAQQRSPEPGCRQRGVPREQGAWRRGNGGEGANLEKFIDRNIKLK